MTKSLKETCAINCMAFEWRGDTNERCPIPNVAQVPMKFHQSKRPLRRSTEMNLRIRTNMR